MSAWRFLNSSHAVYEGFRPSCGAIPISCTVILAYSCSAAVIVVAARYQLIVVHWRGGTGRNPAYAQTDQSSFARVLCWSSVGRRDACQRAILLSAAALRVWLWLWPRLADLEWLPARLHGPRRCVSAISRPCRRRVADLEWLPAWLHNPRRCLSALSRVLNSDTPCRPSRQNR